MSVEIVMTRESFDCLEKAHPEGGVRGHAGPGVSAGLRYATSPGRAHGSLEIAERLLELARPSCGPAAEDIRIAIAEYRKSTGGA